MGSYKHYKNQGQAGDVVFVTATCLDFAHLFAREELRSAMRASLLSDLARTKTVLHAYVVMTHHIHLVVKAPDALDPQALLKLVKKNSCDRLSPLLSSGERAQLAQQTGLNSRKFWQRSFRSLVVERNKTFWQKVGYVHENPMRAGLCQTAEDYGWSSARAFTERRWSWEEGCLPACLEYSRERK